ncbi:hypothetical protein HRW21_17220 [Streptomyces lunaelactis]|nr:hypothetical protein [Streptomyces lunaelactis]NUK17005.1 hypothetical protein [Streptomyces lunaelactis]
MLDGGGGGGGGAPKGASDVERGVGALKDFQNKVNELLDRLNEGPAGRSKVSLANVNRASFGGHKGAGFAEAEDFFDQYERVHNLLVSFSKGLGDQIALLSIGVHAADVGYDNVEEEMRGRFHAIQARLEQARDAAESRKPDEPSKSSEPPRNNDTSAPKSLK